MRPATLAEAIQRIVDGTTQEKALPEFLDTFYLAPTAESRLAAIAERPVPTGDRQLDAFVGGAAEYLARQYELPAIPNGFSSRIDISIAPGTHRRSMHPR